MKKNILTTLFFSFSFFFAICQPTIQWQKSLGGSGLDNGVIIQQTNDGGFIAAGGSNSNDGDVSGNHGINDFWVVKLNDTGTIEWQKSLGGTSNDEAVSIQQTNDGGYVVAGYSKSNDGEVSGNHGNADYWVVKLTNNGTIEWQKSLGGSGFDYVNSIQQTNDGGYIVAGQSDSNDGDVSGNQGGPDCWDVKLSSLGTIEWQKSLGGTGDESAFFIQETNDGGYVFAGYSKSNDGDVSGNHGNADYWVVKLTNTGTIEWQKSLGGSSFEQANAIQQANDGGYVVSGYSISNDGDVSGNHGNADYWVVKLTNTGIIEWQKSLGGSADDVAFTMQHANDGGYIVAGQSSSNDGDVSGNQGTVDYWAIKLTGIGAIEWQKSLGGTSDERAYSVQQTMDGGYIVAGHSSSNDGDVSGNNGSYDFWVVKLNTCQPIETFLTFNECNPFSFNGITYSNSGIYTQTLVNSSGCDSILNINAEILNLSAQIFQTDSMLYVNGSPTSIQWINCTTGQAIPSATQTSFTPQVSGNYGAVITIGECLDTSNCRQIIKSKVAEKPSSLCDNLIVKPNPVNDQIEFTLDKSVYDIRLFTSTGAIVISTKGNTQKQIINFQDLAPAMYMLQVDECRYKIVKQ
jgi:hypothetical protein